VSTPTRTRGTYLGGVPDRPWSRWRRRRRDGEDGEVHEEPRESADLNDEEYAWWAARDEGETGRVTQGQGRRTSASESDCNSESVFDWSGGGESGGLFDETDPYVVLDLPPTASWDEITSRHRLLAKLHHPDRLFDAAPEQREDSDRRIRDLNIAYMELRRRKGR
jgi:DnaJ-domain-containing protein 1